jgi:anti-anti-sigma factor
VELIFEVQGRNEKLILSCRGQLVCGHEADALQVTFCRLLASTRHITLDLHNVRKMDCAGLGAIVACMTLARQQGKTFDLCFVPAHFEHDQSYRSVSRSPRCRTEERFLDGSLRRLGTNKPHGHKKWDAMASHLYL